MLGFAPISAAPISGIPTGDGPLVLVGQQATAQAGSFGVVVEVALAGQSCSTQQGTLSPEIPLLFTQLATAEFGALIPEIAVTLTGQAATAAGGTLTPEISSGATLIGHTATVEQGQLRPRMQGHTATTARGDLGVTVGVTLTGQVATTASTGVAFETASGGSAAVSLIVAARNIFSGDIEPNVIVGTTALATATTPAVETHVQTGGGGPVAFQARQSQPIFVQGYYLSFGETHDGSADDWATSLAVGFSGVLATDAPYALSLDAPALGSGAQDLNPKYNGNPTQTFPNTGTVFSDAPRKYGQGGQVGIDEDGNFALLRTRYYDYSGYTYPYRRQFYAYHGRFNGYTYHGPEVVVESLDAGYLESSSAAEDGPFNNSMGVVVLPAGAPDADGLNTQNALVFYSSYWNDNGSENWVPTYQRVTQVSTLDGELVGSPVQLTSFTGIDRLYAMQNSLTTTYSGFGDVAYITYLASTPLDPRTPTYVGLIVVNLRSLVVHSHGVTPLAAASSEFTPTKSRYEAYKHLAKPKAEVVQLSSGRRVTQFLQRQFVINLNWSEHDHLSPTLTPKPGPVSSGSGNYLALGAESLDVKGDAVVHTLYHVDASSSWTSSSRLFNFRPFTNDATSTDTTWVLAGSDLWTWTLNWGSSVTHYPEFHVGSKPGYRTWMFQNEVNDNLSSDNLRAGEAFITYWDGQPPILGTEAGSRVGAVTVTIANNEQSVPLSGYQIGVTATHTFFTTNRTVALTGYELDIGYTNPVASNGSATVALQGHVALAAYGQIAASNGVTEVILTGQTCTASAGLTYSIGAILSGHTATTQQGALGLEPTRVRLVSNLIQALFTPFGFDGASLALTGQGAATAGGTFVPEIAPMFTGLSSTASHGSLGVSVEVALTGQSCTTAYGDLSTPVIGACTGHEAEAQYGSLGVAITVGLTGQSASTAYGSFGLATDAEVALTGYACSTVGGTLSSATAVMCSGYAAAISQGDMGVVVAPSLTGSGLTTSHATLAITISRVLSGELMTMAYGTPPLVVDNNPSITGVFATGVLGDTTVPRLPLPSSSNLWAVQGEDRLFSTTDTVEDEFIVATPPD